MPGIFPDYPAPIVHDAADGRDGALGHAELAASADRRDPHALERAFDIARQDTPAGISPDEAVAEINRSGHGHHDLEIAIRGERGRYST
ncbi:hypothetical protein WN73_18195 [Bradyrhizobium sp. CCBAU 45394]|nr:hypothetical protein [Bradyrhizobium sp. CCBAU 45394]MDA9392477.1 hypothetical protein [Bradyrhizobium sp. CCBAU 45394]